MYECVYEQMCVRQCQWENNENTFQEIEIEKF